MELKRPHAPLEGEHTFLGYGWGVPLHVDVTEGTSMHSPEYEKGKM